MIITGVAAPRKQNNVEFRSRIGHTKNTNVRILDGQRRTFSTRNLGNFTCNNTYTNQISPILNAKKNTINPIVYTKF